MNPQLSQSILDAWAAQEAQYGLPRGTLMAMAGVESSYGQNMGPSPAGAVGWHQWMPATQERFGVDPFDPVSSGQGVAQYLDANRKYLTNALGREPTFTELLTSFHSGEGNVAKGNLGPQGRAYAGLVQARMPEWDVSPQQPQPPFGGFDTVQASAMQAQQPSLLDALVQYVGEAAPGGALNPESKLKNIIETIISAEVPAMEAAYSEPIRLSEIPEYPAGMTGSPAVTPEVLKMFAAMLANS